jgi:hypothetical protein
MLRKRFPSIFAEVGVWTHDGLFHLLHGRRGRGKTYNMTAFVNNLVQAHVPVVGNIRFDLYRLAARAKAVGAFETLGDALDFTHERVTFTNDIEVIMSMYDGGVCLDEMQQDFSNKHTSKADRMPSVFLEWMEQSRKHKITLMYASQSFDWLDRHTKQLADRLWESRRIGKDGAPTEFWCYGVDPKGASGNVDHDAVEYKLVSKFDIDVARTYSTHQALPRLTRSARWSTFHELAKELEAKGIRPTPPKPKRTLDEIALEQGLIFGKPEGLKINGLYYA